MRKVTQAVTVFYSSTADEGAKVRKLSVDRVVKKVERSRDVAIRLFYWDEDIPGGVAENTGQDRIDKEVLGAFDVYVGCMGTKFGLGTVKEFSDAIDAHVKTGHPAEVLFAFDETPVNPYQIPDNFKKAKDFRKSLQSATKYGKAILYFTFSDLTQFEDKLQKDLEEAVRQATSRVKGGMPRLR